MLYAWHATSGSLAHLIDAGAAGERETLCLRSTLWHSDMVAGASGVEALKIAARKCRWCERLDPLLRYGVPLVDAQKRVGVR